jgi:hypothetical protein
MRRNGSGIVRRSIEKLLENQIIRNRFHDVETLCAPTHRFLDAARKSSPLRGSGIAAHSVE